MTGLVLSVVAVLGYVNIPSETGLLLAGPVYGFITYGFFGIFGAFLSELFTDETRATANSLCFNFGRGMSMGARISSARCRTTTVSDSVSR